MVITGKVLGFSFLGLGVSIPKGLGDSAIMAGVREVQAEVIGKSRVISFSFFKRLAEMLVLNLFFPHPLENLRTYSLLNNIKVGTTASFVPRWTLTAALLIFYCMFLSSHFVSAFMIVNP